MSENNEELNNEELNIDLGELTPEQLVMMPESEKPQGVTAFIIIKNPDGSWYATADLSQHLLVERKASLDDIKHGCQDVVDSMFQTNIAYQVMDMVKNHLNRPETDQD